MLRSAPDPLRGRAGADIRAEFVNRELLRFSFSNPNTNADSQHSTWPNFHIQNYLEFRITSNHSEYPTICNPFGVLI
jgi:hypothetical protein